jgi:hypothetical protein
MSAAAVSNVVNQEIVERKSRHFQPAKDASGLDVCKQITVPPPAQHHLSSFSAPFSGVCFRPSCHSSVTLVIAIKFIAHSVLN